MDEKLPLVEKSGEEDIPSNYPSTKWKVAALVLFSLLVAAGAIATLVFLIMPVETQSEKPNIVLIVADDAGWADIGYRNSKIYKPSLEIRTPTLDRLAAEGVKLENYYAQPMCTPSRASLLSGKYVIHLGMQHDGLRYNQAVGLPREVPTLANSLRRLGYSTHMVGKWDLGFFKKEYMPTYRGFDSFFGFLTAKEDYFTHISCAPYGNTSDCGLDLRDNEQVVWDNTEYSTHLFTSKAKEVIQQHDNTKPLFLYLPFQAPHAPPQVPVEYTEQYAHIEDQTRREFAGMMSCLDKAVKNVTESLQNAGLLKNTLLVFTSDNGAVVQGGGSNWPLRGEKGSLWEGGIRVPAFVHGAGLQQPGISWQGLMHISDWYPTLVHLAGGSIQPSLNLDGQDLWEAISSGGESPRREILHNIDTLTEPRGEQSSPDGFNTQVRAAIRSGKWKLLTGNPDSQHDSGLVGDNGVSEDAKNVLLFDIENDPFEEFDLSDGHPGVVRYMLDLLQVYNDTAVPAVYPPVDIRSAPSLHGGVWGPWL